jgi:hypothetical protein
VLLKRGGGQTSERLRELDVLLCGDRTAKKGSGLSRFEGLVRELELPSVGPASPEDLSVLAQGVNAQRLANFPLELSPDEIRALYGEALA